MLKQKQKLRQRLRLRPTMISRMQQEGKLELHSS